MKRILLTYTLAFALLPVYAGEGEAPPLIRVFRLIM